MKDTIEASIEIIKRTFGYEVPGVWVPYLILAIAFGPLAMWLYFLIRRWRGDFRAISTDMEAAVNVIAHDTRTELNGLFAKFSTIHDDLKATMVGRFEALQLLMKSTEDVTSDADKEAVLEEQSSAPTSRTNRLKLAEQVRNAVVAKWLEGRPLVQVSMNCFQYIGTSESGSEIKIYFQTPYRPTVTSDGRLPFTLEVWVNGYKQLNFEWDFDGKYALRNFRKGDWISEVAEWQFPMAQSQAQAA